MRETLPIFLPLLLTAGLVPVVLAWVRRLARCPAVSPRANAERATPLSQKASLVPPAAWPAADLSAGVVVLLDRLSLGGLPVGQPSSAPSPFGSASAESRSVVLQTGSLAPPGRVVSGGSGARPYGLRRDDGSTAPLPNRAPLPPPVY